MGNFQAPFVFRLNTIRNIQYKPKSSIYQTLNQAGSLDGITRWFPPKPGELPVFTTIWLGVLQDPIDLALSYEDFIARLHKEVGPIFDDVDIEIYGTTTQECKQAGRPTIEGFFQNDNGIIEADDLAHFTAHLLIDYATYCIDAPEDEPQDFEYQEVVFPNSYNAKEIIIAFNFPTLIDQLSIFTGITLNYIDAWVTGQETATPFIEMMKRQADIIHDLRRT